MQKLRPAEAVERLNNNDETLTGLDLTGNATFDMKSGQYTEQVGNALRTNTHLTRLSLGNLSINDNTVLHICEALRVNHTLKELDLSNNKFGTDGLIALSEALCQNHTLVQLNVIGQSKDFGEPAMFKIIELFEHNTTLTNIIWRLHSRQSFTINRLIVRNKEIERRKESGLPYDDLDPESRRSGGFSSQSEQLPDDVQQTSQTSNNNN